jgi:hypothetical protein
MAFKQQVEGKISSATKKKKISGKKHNAEY